MWASGVAVAPGCSRRYLSVTSTTPAPPSVTWLQSNRSNTTFHNGIGGVVTTRIPSRSGTPPNRVVCALGLFFAFAKLICEIARR